MNTQFKQNYEEGKIQDSDFGKITVCSTVGSDAFVNNNLLQFQQEGQQISPCQSLLNQNTFVQQNFNSIVTNRNKLTSTKQTLFDNAHNINTQEFTHQQQLQKNGKICQYRDISYNLQFQKHQQQHCLSKQVFAIQYPQFQNHQTQNEQYLQQPDKKYQQQLKKDLKDETLDIDKDLAYLEDSLKKALRPVQLNV
ncbi:hypothetical protein PPERSA_07782 [Pseudocohnilembus persalinus]|uniref:Uncharacterized protein n=1 Tax=Pseudocohnilembus persalinus TaxID=266149 RepID=A0A0V0QBV5_PSEPJ|nr:hypothetical protein PPERSA_07782 [Pseudocohnilembus persalinus]|eukprot:KRW99705.1 hypothetical protein PPERSA_07782 [Pseudocohnilembus persalinus]